MFGPTATLNFGAPAPSPGEAAAQAQQPQPPEAFPAAVPDGAQQLAMLATPPVNYQQAPDLNAPLTSPPPPEAQQSSQQGEQLACWEGSPGASKHPELWPENDGQLPVCVLPNGLRGAKLSCGCRDSRAFEPLPWRQASWQWAVHCTGASRSCPEHSMQTNTNVVAAYIMAHV